LSILIFSSKVLLICLLVLYLYS